MNPEIPDDLDRVIDEALAAAVAGEPRCVDAASVRRAAAEQAQPTFPAWLGLAAALALAFAGVLFLRPAVEPGPSTVASAPLDSRGPAEAHLEVSSSRSPQPLARSETEPIRVGVTRSPARLSPASRPAPTQELTTEPPYEGLPRLVIAPLDAPDSLSPREFENGEILIAALEIPPLTLAGLSHEPEP